SGPGPTCARRTMSGQISFSSPALIARTSTFHSADVSLTRLPRLADADLGPCRERPQAGPRLCVSGPFAWLRERGITKGWPKRPEWSDGERADPGGACRADGGAGGSAARVALARAHRLRIGADVQARRRAADTLDPVAPPTRDRPRRDRGGRAGAGVPRRLHRGDV